MWNLKNSRLFPEDIVIYFAEVSDNDEITGPKTSKTRIFSIRYPSLIELFEQTALIQEEQENAFEEILEESRELQKNSRMQ